MLYILLLLVSGISWAQIPPDTLDLNKFSGKWYVVASIPTCFDKKWNNITETFELAKNGDVDIHITYVKEGEAITREKKAKGFPYKENKNTEWEVQFMWPFTSGYLVEEIAPDYSYVVIGHSQKFYFYIMSRTGTLDEALFRDIMLRAIKKGYETDDLRVVIQ
jgi:apolipoprotein D and lipocalin family protein